MAKKKSLMNKALNGTIKTEKNMLRVCYINPTILVKRPICEISAGISNLGAQTTVLFPKKLFKSADDSLHHNVLLKKSSIKNYSTLDMPFIKSEQPLPVTPVFFMETFKLLRENDIIHMWVPYYLSNLWIITIKKIFYPKKILILTMDTVPGYSFSMGKSMDFFFKMYDKLFGWAIFKTPNVITLYGNSLVPYALKAGMKESKMRVLSTGISMKKISREDTETIRKDVHKEFKIPSNTKIVLFAGLMVPRKGVEKIIQIASDLKKEDVIFILAGDGPEKNKYISHVKKSGLYDKVFFLGWRKDMARLYQGSDLFVLPAEGEGLPGVVMEAMSYGVPCVASNIPCIPDLIEDGVDGFLCDKDSHESFSKKIRVLIKNDSLRKKMKHNALMKMKRFDWNMIITKYYALYNELLSKNMHQEKNDARMR